MIQKIKGYMLVLTSFLMLAAPVAVPALAYAAPPDESDSAGCNSHISNQVANGAGDAAGNAVDCNAEGNGTAGLAAIAKKVVNIFSFVVGAIAIIMIIYGGFRYITSGGDSGNVGNAKNTLIYAIVGLIIVALAQIIVQFVLSTTGSAVEAGSSGG